MEQKDILENVRERARQWTEGSFDEATRQEVKKLLEGNEADLIEAFYKDLEFGTGGLRGIMGPGTNRMNIYTVGMATQGLSNYLKKEFQNREEIRVAIAHDCRNNSRLFAKTAARIFAGNGFRVFLFDALRPTPELSFAIRLLKCQAGVVVTASHNPKEYNGYKAYWEDGAQVIEPHDRNIIHEVQQIRDISEVRFGGPEELIEIIGEEVDDLYLEKVLSLSLSPAAIRNQKDLKIVYTPIHGSGVNLVPMALRKLGFEQLIHVPEQDIPDGNFPTVVSPNPEEPAALEMAINKARETGAELVMATDPDADRVGVAVRTVRGDYQLLNGNQTVVLLVYYMLRRWHELDRLKGKEFIVKTIVTTELVNEIAEKYGVKFYDVLTGFKFIADIIRKEEGNTTYIGGGEESYGFLAGDFVRDKDAVSACSLVAEIAAWAKDQGKSLLDLLTDIYLEFGFYKESLTNIVRKGKSGAEEIEKMMEGFRSSPPDSIAGSDVMLIHDYLRQYSYDQVSHLRHPIHLPKSNVLQFILKDGSKISVRPSGTEPKIKFYFSVHEKLEHREDQDRVSKLLDERILAIKRAMGIDS